MRGGCVRVGLPKDRGRQETSTNAVPQDLAVTSFVVDRDYTILETDDEQLAAGMYLWDGRPDVELMVRGLHDEAWRTGSIDFEGVHNGIRYLVSSRRTGDRLAITRWQLGPVSYVPSLCARLRAARAALRSAIDDPVRPFVHASVPQPRLRVLQGGLPASPPQKARPRRRRAPEAS